MLFLSMIVSIYNVSVMLYSTHVLSVLERQETFFDIRIDIKTKRDSSDEVGY